MEDNVANMQYGWTNKVIDIIWYEDDSILYIVVDFMK